MSSDDEKVTIKDFCNTAHEFHALIMGWGEAIYPREPRFKMGMESKNPVDGEYWYYTTGLALGVFTWVGIVIGCIKLLL